MPAKRKNPHADPVQGTRRTRRQKQLASDNPSEGEPTATAGPGLMAAPSSSNEKALSDDKIVREVLKMVTSREKAQLMIISLMLEYNFNHMYLKELLLAHRIDASFSKVEYPEITPKVGLDPVKGGYDIPTFEMHRARLPHNICHDIVIDLMVRTNQYGTPEFHQNEEATSRWISGHFNRILTLFSGALFNTPETLLESDTTKSGRVEYQYTVAGGISVLFIEIKLKVGNNCERLEYFGQVIAECIACSFINSQNGFNLPILGILCDGGQFQFFEFQKEKGREFRMGVFADGAQRIIVASPSRWDSHFDIQQAVLQIRSSCEALYYCFLRAFTTGLNAYWNRSVQRSKAECKGRESTPKWKHAVILAERALEEAKHGRLQYEKGELAASQTTAENAVKMLSQSIDEAPIRKHQYLPDFTSDMLDK